MNEWIPVNEQRPLCNGKYLVTIEVSKELLGKKYYTCEAIYNPQAWKDGWYENGVIAWRSLSCVNKA